MDFNDTPEEAAFRAEARAFLDANAEPKNRARPVLRSAATSVRDAVQRCKAWQAKKADAGFAAITWPKRFGGREASPILAVIYQPGGRDLRGAARPVRDRPRHVHPDHDGLREAGTAAIATCRPALRGEEVWCQLFSEPAGGSDLAALRTRAERDGDDWIINGQKIWTSGAHLSDFGIIVVRTDPNVPKHEGLTFFFLDMKSPGIEIRPIHQMSGASHFNEVFFTDVRVPDAQRLGAVGAGLEGLADHADERAPCRSGEVHRPDVEDLLELSRRLVLMAAGDLSDGAVRERIAEWYARTQGLKFTRFRTMTALSRGQTPGPENSIHKLVNASKLQDIASYGMDLMGMAGLVMDDDLAEALRDVPAGAAVARRALASPAASDEILRNIIAERVIGLPADIRVDKNRPFNQVPTGRR